MNPGEVEFVVDLVELFELSPPDALDVVRIWDRRSTSSERGVRRAALCYWVAQMHTEWVACRGIA